MFAVIKFLIPLHSLPKIDRISHPAIIDGVEDAWSLAVWIKPENINTDSEFKFLEVKPLMPDAPFKLGSRFTLISGEKKILQGEIIFNGNTQEEDLLKSKLEKSNQEVIAYRMAAMEDVGLNTVDKVANLHTRINELETAIKKHREQTGHNMCWENDEELWSVLNDGVKIDHTPPNWCEFMTKCAEYRASKDKK